MLGLWAPIVVTITPAKEPKKHHKTIVLSAPKAPFAVDVSSADERASTRAFQQSHIDPDFLKDPCKFQYLTLGQEPKVLVLKVKHVWRDTPKMEIHVGYR